MLRAVFFDLDETLLDHRGAARAASTILAGELGHPDPAAAVALWFALEREFYDRYLAGELTYARQQRERARALARSAGHELTDAAADAAFAVYRGHYRDSWRAFPDVAGCLDGLRTRPQLRWGVITNGDPDNQRRKLDRIGVLDEMDVVVTSGEVGWAKPDPRIFAEACVRMGVRPAEAIVVGDRVDVDVVGARGAGLTGIWLDRGPLDGGQFDGRPRDGGAGSGAAPPAADVETITSLSELPALLDRRR